MHPYLPLMTAYPFPNASAFRTQRRITITLLLNTFNDLLQRCDEEGRSLQQLSRLSTGDLVEITVIRATR
jgi:hypothetical protein